MQAFLFFFFFFRVCAPQGESSFLALLAKTVETGDKNRDVSVFHCMQMSRMMSMRGLFSTIVEMKVKNDHRSEFSNLSNWKEEA